MRQELSDEYDHCLRELRDDEHNEMDQDCSIDCQSDGLLASAIEHLARQIRTIDVTLKRIYEGSYGVCVECGRSISEKRLRANPTAQRCIRCQRKVEAQR